MKAKSEILKKSMERGEELFKKLLSYLDFDNPVYVRVKKGMVPGMYVEGRVYLNETLRKHLREELQLACETQRSFIASVIQIANVCTLPGIISPSIGMPDIHSGYGFAIGQVAAFNYHHPDAVVSPGGVGFDINCGVRLIRTNLQLKAIEPHISDILSNMYDRIPVGVGTSKKGLKLKEEELEEVLEKGIEYCIEKGYAWPEDRSYCEEQGRMREACVDAVSKRAMKRGKGQLGSLGSGNHYIEIQCVDQILDKEKAAKMGFTSEGQVCIMMHSGSRGVGHQVATDYVDEMNQSNQDIPLLDPQLACARIQSPVGQRYIQAMACAANYAFANRGIMTYGVRKAFEEVLGKDAADLDMHIVYDVCHNIAKREVHMVDGKEMEVLVHRKGATRAFGPMHPDLPAAYAEMGQPVLVGGTMGTASYVLVGTTGGMMHTFGSTCHGAGRALSRHKARKTLTPIGVMDEMEEKGIQVKVATPKLIAEEAPQAYKDVEEVVDSCVAAGISGKVVRLRPVAVMKG